MRGSVTITAADVEGAADPIRRLLKLGVPRGLIAVDTGVAGLVLGLWREGPDGRPVPDRRAIVRLIKAGDLQALAFGRGFRVTLRAIRDFERAAVWCGAKGGGE